MSKSDEELISLILLIVVGLAVVIFIVWLIASAIQFLNDNRFVYGLIVGCVAGLVTGIGGTIGIQQLIEWRRKRQS